MQKIRDNLHESQTMCFNFFIISLRVYKSPVFSPLCAGAPPASYWPAWSQYVFAEGFKTRRKICHSSIFCTNRINPKSLNFIFNTVHKGPLLNVLPAPLQSLSQVNGSCLSRQMSTTNSPNKLTTTDAQLVCSVRRPFTPAAAVC